MDIIREAMILKALTTLFEHATARQICDLCEQQIWSLLGLDSFTARNEYAKCEQAHYHYSRLEQV